MRFVVASRYDSGGGILISYYTILVEMWNNSVPRRLMKLCLHRARRYKLGRKASAKHYWLSALGWHVYHLNLIGGGYLEFENDLRKLYLRRGLSLNHFNLTDDVTGHHAFEPLVKDDYINENEPVFVFPYRGKHSKTLYNHLRTCYSRINVVYRHDRYYGNRRMFLKGVTRLSVSQRVAKYRSKIRKATTMVMPPNRSFICD